MINKGRQLAFFSLFVAASTLLAPSGHAAPPASDGMTSHDAAYSAIVAAVALGDAPKALESSKTMHASLDRMLEGVRSGQLVLPKNSSRTGDFVDMELKFRNKLEALERAARHGNQREMQRITNMMLGGCVSCHQAFRK